MAQPAIDQARAAHVARGAVLRARLTVAVQVMLSGVLLALGLRSFVYEPFNIPSESMQPALLVGDYLFVAKWPYGLSRYALPLSLPLFEGRLFAAPAQRGDIVVFKSPANNRTDFVKRVIGLPGDRVRMVHGQIEINGSLVPRQRLSDFTLTARPEGGCHAAPPMGACQVRRYRETLPGGRSFAVLDEVSDAPHDNSAMVIVPAGSYFVLGDNRDDSADSRLPVADGGVGMVPAANLIGRADRIFFSLDVEPGGRSVRWNRIGRAL